MSELNRNEHNLTTTLTIEHAQLKDAGDYLCEGWTSNVTKASVITVFVNGKGGCSSQFRRYIFVLQNVLSLLMTRAPKHSLPKVTYSFKCRSFR